MKTSIQKSLMTIMCLLFGSLSIVSCSSFGAASNFSKNSMTLNVIETTAAISFFPLYVAQQESFFSAQGLTLDPAAPSQLGTGAKVTAAVEANQAEIVGGGLITDAFNLVKVDSSIKILGSLTNAYLVDIAVSKHLEQQTHLTATSPLADKVKALVGKKIGITGLGSGTEALLIYLFKLYGYDVGRDATLVSMGNSNAAAGLATLRTGQVDALSFFTPTAQTAASQGIGDVFISPLRGDIPSMQGQAHGVFYAKQSVIDAKPKAVQAFIRGIAQAEAFIHSHQAQTITLLAKYLNLSQAASKALLSATLPIIAASPQISPQGYAKAAQFHVQGGLLTTAPKYESIIATSTITSALKGLPGSSQ